MNRFPPNSSYDMATTTLHKTSHNNMLNTIINPTISQNLGTPTPAIIPAVTSCSPCIQTISNIISKITETHVDKVHITITSTVRAPCMPTPISKESKSCNFTTKTIVSTVQPPSVSVQDVKVCSSTESSALGALLGISTVLLALVTAGWIWTCWIVKKRGRMVVNSKLNK